MQYQLGWGVECWRLASLVLVQREMWCGAAAGLEAAEVWPSMVERCCAGSGDACVLAARMPGCARCWVVGKSCVRLCMCSAGSGVAALASRGEPCAGVLSRVSVCSRGAWAAVGAQADVAAPGNAGAMGTGARDFGELFETLREYLIHY